MVEIRPGLVVDGRFQVIRSIGVGGVAAVYAVHDTASGRRFAMKVLHRHVLANASVTQRFLREAQAAHALETPFAVRIEGTGSLPDGSAYILMELLEGLTLNEIISRSGPQIDVERALYLADQVAQGLHDAHTRGIVHRDLKPDNIFVLSTPQGEFVKIVDFGISKVFSEDCGPKITKTGVTVGTPQYMPVEQLRGEDGIDGRIDVYALGVLLYEMLAGSRPYDGFTYEEVILKVATTIAPSIGTLRADLPHGLVGVVDRAMARNKNERIASMAQLRQELAPYWSGRSPLVGAAPPAVVPVSAEHVSSGIPMQNFDGQSGAKARNQRASAGKTLEIHNAPAPFSSQCAQPSSALASSAVASSAVASSATPASALPRKALAPTALEPIAPEPTALAPTMALSVSGQDAIADLQPSVPAGGTDARPASGSMLKGLSGLSIGVVTVLVIAAVVIVLLLVAIVIVLVVVHA